MNFEEQARDNARHQQEWAQVVQEHHARKQREAIEHLFATRGHDPNYTEWLAEATI